MFILRIVLVTFGLLLLAIVSALYLGHQQPEDVVTRDISLCDGHVCIRGIASNVTTINEATTIILSDPRLEPPNPQIKLDKDMVLAAYSQVTPFYGLFFYSDKENIRITRIGIDFHRNSQLMAQNIVAKFGTPCAISVFNPDLAIFTYPGMNIFFTDPAYSQAGRFMLTASVREITLFDNHVQACSQVTFTGNVKHWRGFRRY